MAKEESKAKIVLERTYNVPLRKEFIKVPKYKRSKKAVMALTQFIAKHMKTDIKNVRIGNFLNNSIWAHGIKNPPHHVKVLLTKDEKGMVYAEFSGKLVKAKEDKPAKKPGKSDIKEAKAAKIEEVKEQEDTSEEFLEESEDVESEENASEEPESEETSKETKAEPKGKKPKAVKKKFASENE
jgi:large subunit ribosomal protein L31e